MVRTRKQKKAAADIKLAQPDRSAPSEQTLLDIAQEHNLFEKADQHPANQRKKRNNVGRGSGNNGDDNDEELLSPTADRIMEALLWTVSLAMLHFTLDVLVQHQYAMEILWHQIVTRALVALVVFFTFFYVLHPHDSSPILLPGLPLRFQDPLRQAIFFVASTAAGCYLVDISNTYGYLYVMKRSPPLGCLWVWSVIELRLSPALASLSIVLGFFFWGGYSLKL
ncbi:putative deacetylase-like protein [Rosellinia necatrix]|uniref:Putative deacetylase-like protein n=1 Tax=Rosellinia necatrix TaxID=77044 RepID=A0A1W2TKM4_ROSNE|nr:putative deacetylase-like protein [Rosellinia necatrix]